GMNVVTLALDAARGERLAVGLLVLDALAPVAGAALSTLVSIPTPTLGLLLAAFGGAFIAIGAGHLLPESQHRDPRRSPALVALAGVGAAIALAVRAISPGRSRSTRTCSSCRCCSASRATPSSTPMACGCTWRRRPSRASTASRP